MRRIDSPGPVAPHCKAKLFRHFRAERLNTVFHQFVWIQSKHFLARVVKISNWPRMYEKYKSWLKLRFSPAGHSLHSSLSSSRTPGLQPWDGKCFTGLHLFAIQNMGAMYDIVSVWWWYHYSKSKTAKKNDKDATDVLNAQRVSLKNIQSKTNKTLKNNFVVWVSFLLTMSFVSETKIMFYECAICLTFLEVL